MTRLVKNAASSWKTTLAGIALIVAGHTLLFVWPEEKMGEAIAMILAGSGLIFARDNDKTSEDVGAAE
jgi:hypothetical protein